MPLRGLRTGLWVAVPIVPVVLLAGFGDSVAESIRCLITWTLSVLVPGFLLWRVLVGSRSTAQDLGFGVVLGTSWQVLIWAVCTALGAPWSQWLAVPALLLVVFLTPPLRRRVTRSPRQPGPGWWPAVLAVCLLLAMVRTAVGLLRDWPLPPIAFDRHQDVWYQLGLVRMLMRDVTPPDPSVLGEPLVYHWFANASIAGQAVMASTDPSHVLMHHWQLTFVTSLVLTGWAAGEALSGKPWAGAAAGALSGVLPGMLQLVASPVVADSPAQVVQGPTSSLAVLVMLGLVGPTALILRRQSTPGTWIALAAMIGLAAGTKPTVLPIMVVGCAVAALFTGVAERRIPWRVVVIGVLAAGCFLAAIPAGLTGSTAGSRIQVLAALRTMPFYQAVTGDRSYPANGGWVLPSIATGDGRLVVFALVLVGYYLLINAARLLSLLGTATSPARRDPAYWWVAGCVAAGTGITLVFSHTGYSEAHFLRTVTALGVVGTVAVASTLVDETTRGRPIVAAAAAAFGVALLTRLFWIGEPEQVTTVVKAFTTLVLPFQVVAAVTAVVVLLTRHRSRSIVLLQVVAAVIAAGLPNQLIVFGENAHRAATGHPVVADEDSRVYLTTAEQEAALWLGRQAEPGDVAISNVFCLPAPYRPGCPDDAFWISGLSGVQLYLGGWAYAPANLAATRNRASFLTQPSPWPDRLQQSLDAVRRPTPGLLAFLKNDVGVDWIFADRRAGPVSPALDRLAERVYANDDVRIYRLR